MELEVHERNFMKFDFVMFIAILLPKPPHQMRKYNSRTNLVYSDIKKLTYVEKLTQINKVFSQVFDRLYNTWKLFECKNKYK